MNKNHKSYDDSFHLLKHLIIVFCIIPANPIPKSGCKHILFSKLNQILLKIKAAGTISIINSDYNFKPSSYYLNEDSNPKTFTNSSIELINIENEVKLIFSNFINTCNSMFKGCSQIIEIDLSNFDSSNVKSINYIFYECTSLKSIKLVISKHQA